MEKKKFDESSIFSSIRNTDEEKKDDKKRHFFNKETVSELKKRYYNAQDELRKNKREQRFDKVRGLDQVKIELNTSTEQIVNPDKIAYMTFSVRFNIKYLGKGFT